MIRDLFSEILNSVRNNKLRTALTGFAVSWGIFLLICLLGAGNGITNAFMKSSDTFVKNSLVVYGGYATLPSNGYKTGRPITLDEGDIKISKGPEFSDHIDIVAPTSNYISTNMVYGSYTIPTELIGVTPEMIEIDKLFMKKGRFINPKDMADSRKVVVLSERHVKGLEEDILGKWVTLEGFSFRVVGIYQHNEADYGLEAFIPYTSAKRIFSPDNKIGRMSLTFHGIHSYKESMAFEDVYSRRLKTYHQANPDDPNAMWIWNRYNQNAQLTQAQSIISVGLWILGLLTLVSGIVGVSNIMLISVKERTHEFGIRKAIGAKPASILSLIIAESVTITAFFGYVGMVLGMLACEIMGKTVGASSVNLGFTEIRMMDNPSVGLDVALEATLLLIVAGTLAGLAPAWKAAKVKPIEALRAE